MTLYFLDPQPRPCGEPSGVYVRGGCVHEHMQLRWLCASHFDAVQHAVCRVCDQMEDNQHDCAVSFEVLTDCRVAS